MFTNKERIENMKMEEVLLENEKLVYSIISKFRGYYDTEDLFQVGMIGFMKAYQNFDESYGTKFTTYAHTYILGEVLKYIREDRNIKISKDMMQLARSVDKAREILSQKLMRTPTITEISLFLEVDESVIEQAERSKEFVRSLDHTLNEEDDGKDLNLYDSIQVEERGFDANILDLKDALNTLPEEEKKLIHLRYFDDLTQSEVSKELGTSQVQVSRKEAKILTKLQQKLAA